MAFRKGLSVAMLVCLGANAIAADTLATASYDVDSYIFLGTTSDPLNQTDAGLDGFTVATDISGGVVNGFNVHFVFSVIQFENLDGLETVANGGPEKHLTLSTLLLPEASTVGVTVAQADINSDTDGYPGHPTLFAGNPTGTSTDRLQWYMDNIKGDDANFGGYAGGAPHLGVFDIGELGTYSINVTETVDAWIEGTLPNFGFGLWGIDAPGGGPGNTIAFNSSENPNGDGPTLEAFAAGFVPGDFDNDADVDADDFTAWQIGYATANNATLSSGDADLDGDVDGADFLIWQQNFVETSGTLASATSVPEPASLLLLITIISCILATRWVRMSLNLNKV